MKIVVPKVNQKVFPVRNNHPPNQSKKKIMILTSLSAVSSIRKRKKKLKLQKIKNMKNK